MGQVDDLNKPFTFPADSFDLVNSRLVGAGINKSRWLSYVGDIIRSVVDKAESCSLH